MYSIANANLRDYYAVYGNVDNFEEADVIIVTNHPDDLQNGKNNALLVNEMNENAVLLVQGFSVGEQINEKTFGMDSPHFIEEISKLQESYNKIQTLMKQFKIEITNYGKNTFGRQVYLELQRTILDEYFTALKTIEEKAWNPEGYTHIIGRFNDLNNMLEEKFKKEETKLLENTSPERQACFQRAIEASVKDHGKTIAIMQISHVNYNPLSSKDGVNFHTFLQTKRFVVFTPKAASSTLDMPHLKDDFFNRKAIAVPVRASSLIPTVSRLDFLMEAFNKLLSKNPVTNKLAALTQVLAERVLGVSSTITTSRGEIRTEERMAMTL